MASRDLTANFIERRNAALKRRGPGGVQALTSPRLTAGGTDEGYSLSLMEVCFLIDPPSPIPMTLCLWIICCVLIVARHHVMLGGSCTGRRWDSNEYFIQTALLGSGC